MVGGAALWRTGERPKIVLKQAAVLQVVADDDIGDCVEDELEIGQVVSFNCTKKILKVKRPSQKLFSWRHAIDHGDTQYKSINTNISRETVKIKFVILLVTLSVIQ